VRVIGKGPPLVLLHGLLGSNRYWGTAFDRLSAGHLLVVPDVLGFGSSPRPPFGYGPQEHGGALLASLDNLQVQEPSLIVGHSLGALLALWLARHHPERVSGVVAFGPPVYRNIEDARQRVSQLAPIERLFGLGSPWSTRVAELACNELCGKRPGLAARLFSRIRPDLPRALLEDATRHSWTSYSETLRRVILNDEGLTWIQEAGPPVLLVAGTRDRHLDLELLGAAVQQSAHAQLELWDGAGHDIPIEQPQRCLAVIERWDDAVRSSPLPKLIGDVSRLSLR